MSREWYPWFPHRFWTSERVAVMDDAAIALYKFLLDHEWENGPFSSDEREMAKLDLAGEQHGIHASLNRPRHERLQRREVLRKRPFVEADVVDARASGAKRRAERIVALAVVQDEHPLVVERHGVQRHQQLG